MPKFSYSNIDSIYFRGEQFHQTYKDADFLTHKINVMKILSRQDELETAMNGLKPGETIEMEGMFLKPGSPLMITKSGRVDEHDVDLEAFTPRRLSGLTAAYVLDNATKFPDLYVSEAEDLGLSWRSPIVPNGPMLHQFRPIHYGPKQFTTTGQPKNSWKIIYLSCVSGTEYFDNHFDVFPLACGLKKYHLKQITAETLLTMMKVRCTEGERVSSRLMETIDGSNNNNIYNNNGNIMQELTCGGTFNFREVINTLPVNIRPLIEYKSLY